MLCTETFNSTPRSTVLYTADQRANLILTWQSLIRCDPLKSIRGRGLRRIALTPFLSLSLSLALLSNLQHSSHRNSDLNNSISFLGIYFRRSFSPNYFLLTVTHSFGTYTSSSFLVSKRFAASLSFIVPFYCLMDQKYLEEVLVRYAVQLSVFVKTECLECVDWLTLLRFSMWTGACIYFALVCGVLALFHWSFISIEVRVATLAEFLEHSEDGSSFADVPHVIATSHRSALK